MSIRGLAPQQFAIPLAHGLNQKADPRALELPALSRCVDVQFDEVGGLQTRYPFGTLGTALFGGGVIADCRRVVQNGSELLCFTKDTLYSWNAQLSKWVSKGTHLAVKLEEASRFVTTGDQVDCDRAELSGTVVYTWVDSGVYVAAVDKTTGSVLVAPTLVGSLSVGAGRPRLVALTTKILLFYQDDTLGPDLLVKALDPADVAAGLAAASTTAISSPDFGERYDVTRVIGADQAVFAARRVTTTSYTVGTVTAGLVVATSTKARVCDGPIAVSCTPDGASVQVVRTDDGAFTIVDIVGDLITISTLADVYTAQAIDSTAGPINQISAAHRSVQNTGAYRCYVHFSYNEQTSAPVIGSYDFGIRTNWVATDNTLGAASTSHRHLGVASRSFDHEGSVYFWAAFGEESRFSGGDAEGFRAALQNTYFLYRDDGFLVAKAVAHRGGGFAASTGHLPGVAEISTGAYAWAGVERRIIQIGGNRHSYGARAPRDITITFDSDEARRTARLGSTLYITGGELLQYDGEGLTEVGFHLYPWYFAGAEDASGANITDGSYAYKVTWRWDNAKGELDRSTTATTGLVAVASGPSEVDFAVVPLVVTHKTSSRTAPAIEFWRTAVNPTEDAPFYLVTSKDPAATGDNGYVTNSTTALSVAFTDDLADADITSAETNPENGAVLEFLAPPAATIIIASSERLFLAGVAGDPNRIWYSRLRQDGEVASFHDALTVSVPRDGGDITGLAFLNETLVVFKETAIYALPGVGLDNLGQGQNYEARRIPSDVGAESAEAIASSERGIVFQSSKGKHLLTNGLGVEYIGGPVSDYDDEPILAVHVMEAQHQIRWLTGSRMLVLDALVGQWAEWTIADGLHATIWGGGYAYLATDGPKTELAAYTTINFGWDIETPWIPLGQIQGFGRVWRILLLGEQRVAHKIRVRLAKNYAADGTYFQDKLHTPSPTGAGNPLQLEQRPSTQEMQAIKIRFTAVSDESEEGSYGTPSDETAKLTSLALELGVERGLNRLPAAQRQ